MRDETSSAAAATQPRRRRILFCSNRYRTYDRRIYESLAEAFDLRVLWVSPPPDDEPVPAWDERIRWSVVAADHRKLTARDVGRSAALLRLALRDGKGCDLVVASTSNSWKARVLYLAARALRVPVAMRTDIWRETARQGRTAVSRAYWRWHQRVTGHLERHADGMLASGIKTAERLAAEGIAAEHILPFRYLHADLAEAPLDERLLGELRRAKGHRVAFLYLGRVMEQKGLVPLIRTFRQLRESGRDAVLWVVGAPITADTGRGDVSVAYFEEARRLAAGDDGIVFLGAVAPEQVHNYYAAADVFVHPHVATVAGKDVYEAWGNVITEAACMGLPIVATDRIPAAFDLVVPGVTGELLAAEHLERDLFAALAPFIDEPGRAARFGRAARARFEVFADPRLNIEALQRVIDRAGC